MHPSVTKQKNMRGSPPRSNKIKEKLGEVFLKRWEKNMTVKNEACEENTKNLPEIQIRRVGFGSFKTSVDLKHPQKCMGTSRV